MLAHLRISLPLAFVLVACGARVETAQQPVVHTSATPAVHRAEALACPSDRAPSDHLPTEPGYPVASTAPSTSDADCTAGVNGRCYGNGHDAWQCSYDTCSTDADCASGQLCSCRQPWHYGTMGPNTCLPSQCRVDADCGPGGYCSPSVDASCGPFFGVTGWYCHKPSDVCFGDDDCAHADGGLDTSFCGYQPTVGTWACLTAQCAG
jgi:hypothetical protein